MNLHVLDHVFPYEVIENIVTVKKLYLEYFTNLHVLDHLQFEKMPFWNHVCG